MRFDLPVGPEVFATEMDVRFGDIDAIGHVNGVVYFRFLEEARMRWLSAIGELPDPQGSGPILINAFCTYDRAIVYPARISASVGVSKIGRTSIDTFTTLTSCGPERTMHAWGGGRVVWVDIPSGKPEPLPGRLRETLQRRMTGYA